MFGFIFHRRRSKPTATFSTPGSAEIAAAIDRGFTALVEGLSPQERRTVDLTTAKMFYGMGFCDCIAVHNDGTTLSEQELAK